MQHESGDSAVLYRTHIHAINKQCKDDIDKWLKLSVLSYLPDVGKYSVNVQIDDAVSTYLMIPTHRMIVRIRTSLDISYAEAFNQTGFDAKSGQTYVEERIEELRKTMTLSDKLDVVMSLLSKIERRLDTLESCMKNAYPERRTTFGLTNR
jgi:hypothetical protein